MSKYNFNNFSDEQKADYLERKALDLQIKANREPNLKIASAMLDEVILLVKIRSNIELKMLRSRLIDIKGA